MSIEMICPYCGHEQENWGEWDIPINWDEFEVTCDNCEKEFRGTAHVEFDCYPVGIYEFNSDGTLGKDISGEMRKKMAKGILYQYRNKCRGDLSFRMYKLPELRRIQCGDDIADKGDYIFWSGKKFWIVRDFLFDWNDYVKVEGRRR